ncbi:MAG: GH39 family glycosyl hydrolase [Desulfuromonadales bacterium]
MNSIKLCSCLLALFFVFQLPSELAIASETLGPIGSQYFGLHMHRAASTTPWPSVPFSSWRLWDAHVQWAEMEPRPGEWNFTTLDRTLELAAQHGVEPLLTLGMTPPWASARPDDFCYYAPGRSAEPKNIEDWRRYVHTVATRYKDRIRIYEIWNEPNLKGFFSGTTSKMIELAAVAYDELKKVDPNITVLSPSSGAGVSHGGPAWLDEYLRLGGGRYADIISYHFYVLPEPPEKMLPLIAQVRQIMTKHGVGNKPLWNTETGWSIVSSKNPLKQGVLDEETAAAYLARAFLLNRSAGVERLYWYAWDNYLMGLASDDGLIVKKAPAAAYTQMVNWLTGASLLGCTLEADANWICRLEQEKGAEALIMWSTESGGWALPSDWKGAMITDLMGRKWEVKGRGVAFGASPVLIEPLR